MRLEEAYHLLRLYARPYGQSGLDVEDLAQDAVMRILYHDEASITPSLLYTILKRLAIDRIRRRQLWGIRSLNWNVRGSEEFEQPVPAHNDTALEAIDRVMVSELYEMARDYPYILLLLPPLVDYPVEELAQILGTTYGTINSAKFEARQVLRGKAKRARGKLLPLMTRLVGELDP